MPAEQTNKALLEDQLEGSGGGVAHRPPRSIGRSAGSSSEGVRLWLECASLGIPGGAVDLCDVREISSPLL